MKFDLHVHTHYSKCSLIKPLELLKAAKKKKLDGIAVVDHGTINGSIAVSKLNKDRDFTVLKGMEIYSSIGHLLAIDIQGEIKSQEFNDIVDDVRSQHGILVIAHPYSLSPYHCLKVHPSAIAGKVDAMEVYNSRNGFFGNHKAKAVASEYNLPLTAGSDAHFLFEVGNAVTCFDGKLKTALKKKATKTSGRIGFGPVCSLLSAAVKVVR